jgi:hypothetical protein
MVLPADSRVVVWEPSLQTFRYGLTAKLYDGTTVFTRLVLYVWPVRIALTPKQCEIVKVKQNCRFVLLTTSPCGQTSMEPEPMYVCGHSFV